MTPYKAFLKAYAKNKRLLKMEPLVLQEAFSAFLYAKDVIRGRWKGAEPIILKDSAWGSDDGYGYYYARDVLKWRIKGNKDFYITAMPTLWDRFPKRVKSSPDIIAAYFKEIILK
jgi:hypothetical protein